MATAWTELHLADSADQCVTLAVRLSEAPLTGEILMHPKYLILASALTAACAWSTAVQAVDVERVPSSTATGLCQPALPVFDGNIRKRPLAVQNEGSGPAFVTCSLPAEGTAFGGTKRIFIFFVNQNSTAIDTSCTLVNSLTNSASYFPKSISVPGNPSGNGFQVEWTAAADNGGNNFSRWVSVSCSLPPGLGIGHLGKSHDVNIGN